jgi:predicted phosphoribosyltransferase
VALRGLDAEEVIVALPVASSDTTAELRARADELVCLAQALRAIDAWYEDFSDITDADVDELLDRNLRDTDTGEERGGSAVGEDRPAT